MNRPRGAIQFHVRRWAFRERVHNNIYTFSLGHHYDTFSKVTISTKKDVFFGNIVLIKTTVPAGFKSPFIDLIVFSTQVMTCITLADAGHTCGQRHVMLFL